MKVQKYLEPLADLCYLVTGFTQYGYRYGKRKEMFTALIVHISAVYLKMDDMQIIENLTISRLRLKDIKQFFIENNKSAILSNISYGIYISYLNELKTLDLKENNNED